MRFGFGGNVRNGTADFLRLVTGGQPTCIEAQPVNHFARPAAIHDVQQRALGGRDGRRGGGDSGREPGELGGVDWN